MSAPTSKSTSTDEKKKAPKTESWVELLALLCIAPNKIGDAKKVLNGKLGVGQVARVYEQVFKWYDGAEPPYATGFLKQLPEDVSKKITVAAAELESQKVDSDSVEEDIDQRLSKIKGQLREKIKSNFAQKIAEAERAGDIKKVKELMMDLTKKIR